MKNKTIEIFPIDTKKQTTDIFTKPVERKSISLFEKEIFRMVEKLSKVLDTRKCFIPVISGILCLTLEFRIC